MSRLALLALAMGLTLSGPALAQSKKRAAPAPVAPVVADGVRYQAQPWGYLAGQRENGGYVSAVEAASGRELWTAKVYGTRRTDEIEDDKQDVFITRLTILPGGHTLLVENESGARFVLDLATHKARPE